MSNPLPLTIDFGTLPQTGAGYTPQEMANRLGTNGRIFTEQAFALFTTGTTAPTSDTGPWAANGRSWYYFDSDTGTYVPFDIPQSSLGYYVGSDEPDPDVYQFWIELAVSGSPLALKTYFGGAWVDVYATTLGGYLTTAAAAATYLTQVSAAATYQTIAGMANYSTTAQMNAAINSAVADIVVGDASFSARPSGVQNVVFAAPGNQAGVVTLATEDFDPDSVFATSTFTAPSDGYYQFNFVMSVSITGGVATQLDILTYLAKNGTVVDSANVLDGAETLNGGVFTGTAYLSLLENDTIDLRYDITSDAALTAEIQPNYTRLSGFRVR